MENERKLIKWWNYASFWKFFGIAIIAMICSILSAVIVRNEWCLVGVFLSCGICGYFMRKLYPDMLMDLQKEMGNP